MGPHGWPDSVLPLATAGWPISTEQGEGALFWSFNTVCFQHSRISHRLALLPLFPKIWKLCKKTQLCLPGKELFPLGYTYNTREFIKTEENLYAPFLAVFIMPKAFVQNHFLLNCFCQPGAPCMSVGPKRAGRAPSEQNYTKPPALQRCVEEVILFTSKQTRSYISLLSLPDEQTNIQSKPCNKKVQIFLHLLHHKSLFISRNVQNLILFDIDFTVFSFTECFLLPM